MDWRKDLFQYVKFVFGGGISLVLNLIVTYVLTEFLHLWHMVSFGIALLLEIIFLFGYHSFITFKKNGRFVSFATVVLIISGLNWVAVYLLTEVLSLQYMIAIVLSAGTISIANYLINKKLVFKDN